MMIGEELTSGSKPFYPLYTDGLFQCYMLDEFICHFRSVGSVLSLYSIFDGKSY